MERIDLIRAAVFEDPSLDDMPGSDGGERTGGQAARVAGCFGVGQGLAPAVERV